MLESISLVSEVESSSAEGENEVSRERLAIFTERWRALLGADRLAIYGPMFQPSFFIVRS